MALFVEELGIKGPAVPFYAGIAVASSSLTSALMAPIWGSLADRYGRKPMMLRASIAMTMTMGGIAFVPSVFWLLLLRLLNGVFSGFVPNSTALIASQVPKNQSGYALGTLSTGTVAGTLMGPLLGGLIAEQFGMRNVFLLVGFFLFLVSVLTWWGIEEDYQQISKEEHLSSWALLASIQHKDILLGLFFDQYDHPDDRPIYFSHSSPLCKRAWSERQCYFCIWADRISDGDFQYPDIGMDGKARR